jgi:hypothetical protein
MGFLGDAKESSPIVFTEFHVEVLPFDLDLLRFDNIVHVGRSVAAFGALWKQKIRLNFTDQKAKIWLQFVTNGVCAGSGRGQVSDQRWQNQFVA